MYFYKDYKMVNIKNKKGVVVLATFAMILGFALLVLIMSYTFYSSKQAEFNSVIDNEEVINSLISFRTSIIKMESYDNSTFIYQNILDPEGIEISLDNQTIMGKIIQNDVLIKHNISTLGLKFCEKYSFYPHIESTFKNMGSCIKYIPR